MFCVRKNTETDSLLFENYFYLYFFLSIITIFIIFSFHILYLVFSILTLINNYNLWNDSNCSYLQNYVLISIILSFYRIILFYILCKKKYEQICNLNNIKLFSLFLCDLILLIWGGFEIFKDYSLNNNCNKLKNNNLWNIALINFILQSITIFILIIYFINFMYIRYNHIKNSNKTNIVIININDAFSEKTSFNDCEFADCGKEIDL